MTIAKHRSLALKTASLPARCMAAALALAGVLNGCSSSAHIPTAAASGPQLYMSPSVYGGTGSATATQASYSIDNTTQPPVFAQSTYAFSDTQAGAQIQYSGQTATLARGLRQLELTYACGTRTVNGCNGVTYSPPQANGWMFAWADQSAGLLQLSGQPFVPLLPAVACPSMKTAQTFLYITLPAPLINSGTGPLTWNPQLETAYGSADISASGSTVTFANINQSLLGGGTPSVAPASSITGACSSTVYGNTVAVPANPAVTSTGTSSTVVTEPQAILGIGPSGLLVEDNGGSKISSKPYYENSLGAGTGAIGLPKPSAAVSIGSLVSAQYMGFFYGSGMAGSTANWSSSPASFGFSNLPSACATVATQTSTILYGGDFTANNPAAPAVQANGGFGNCNFAIDLGAQDTKTFGLFPSAIIHVGSSFSANTTGKNYSFSAVAIAGQLTNGKFAIFVLGKDMTGSPNQAWGIYLLQSN